MIAIQEINNNGIYNNNKDLKYMKDISKKDEELSIFTPYSGSYQSLHSNTLTSNTSFLYDSESDGSLPSLRIGQYSLDTDSDHADDDDDDDVGVDEEQQTDDMDPDLIPLIDRITPPPPLLFNNNCDDVDSDKNDDDYNDYIFYHDDDYDHDDNLQIMTKSNELFSNLSIVIPSPLTLSQSSPVYEQNAKCSLLELYNTVTPIPSDNDDESDSLTKFEQSDSDKYDIMESFKTNNNRKSNEKRFEWNVPNGNNHTVIMNDYLVAHIQDLLDDNLSD